MVFVFCLCKIVLVNKKIIKKTTNVCSGVYDGQTNIRQNILERKKEPCVSAAEFNLRRQRKKYFTN